MEEALVGDALPKLISEVTDDEFREALESHLTETEGHVNRLKSVFEPRTALQFSAR